MLIFKKLCFFKITLSLIFLNLLGSSTWNQRQMLEQLGTLIYSLSTSSYRGIRTAQITCSKPPFSAIMRTLIYAF